MKVSWDATGRKLGKLEWDAMLLKTQNIWKDTQHDLEFKIQGLPSIAEKEMSAYPKLSDNNGIQTDDQRPF